ncbi:uncharacterized protein BDZ99DRAFT_471993 [Mytilinidion resinicola]|uniref:Uncharacterized protein n=1 Tax=Mytilinidion resinicola TaxID=574789 RepID=A0A6A6Z094_9PEZI|nr:uncharacterized protein BDZ99DRAFT_471993 [Mytilinidion resinicola]KAF2814582.1 hypothetical protein BDZ99DRAFT_471993 [Mytilinidion resinicola]
MNYPLGRSLPLTARKQHNSVRKRKREKGRVRDPWGGVHAGDREPYELLILVCCNPSPGRFVAGDRLEVKIRRVWMNFQEWVRTLHRDAEQYVGDVGFQKQAMWWARNGKQFRVMELPKELRLAVFGQAIGVGLYSEASFRATEDGEEIWIASLGYGYKPPEEWAGTARRADIVDVPNYALLRVSKQVYAECRDAAFLSRVSFADQTHADILPLLKTLRVLIPNVFTHIGLSFSMMEYIYFFGIRVQPWLDEGRIASPPPACNFLLNVPTLQRLGIKLPSPIQLDHDVREENSIKAKWQTVLEAQKKGTYVDMDDEMRAIESTSMDDLPPKCNCAYPCDSGAVRYFTTSDKEPTRLLRN